MSPLENFLAHEIKWHVGYMFIYNTECSTAALHGQYLMNSLWKNLLDALVSMATSYRAVPDIWFSLFYLFLSLCSITTGLFNMLVLLTLLLAGSQQQRAWVPYLLASPLAGFSLISHFDVSHTQEEKTAFRHERLPCFFFYIKRNYYSFSLSYIYIGYSNNQQRLISAGHVFFLNFILRFYLEINLGQNINITFCLFLIDHNGNVNKTLFRVWHFSRRWWNVNLIGNWL